MTARRNPRRPDVTTTGIVGGPERLEVSLHAYGDRRPEVYRTHRRRIEDALAGRAVDIPHIGSTAVPGLAAKPKTPPARATLG